MIAVALIVVVVVLVLKLFAGYIGAGLDWLIAVPPVPVPGPAPPQCGFRSYEQACWCGECESQKWASVCA